MQNQLYKRSAWLRCSTFGRILYVTGFYFFIQCAAHSASAETHASTIPPPASTAAAGQAAASAKMQQIKTLFDQADYNHLENPSDVLSSLYFAP